MLIFFMTVFAIQALFFAAIISLFVTSHLRHKEWMGAAFMTMLLLADLKLDHYLYNYLFT